MESNLEITNDNELCELLTSWYNEDAVYSIHFCEHRRMLSVERLLGELTQCLEADECLEDMGSPHWQDNVTWIKNGVEYIRRTYMNKGE